MRETLGDLCRSDSRLFLVATYTDRKMCWSTSLYSSSTNHHLYRVQLFSDTKHETENSVGEKEKPLSFWKGKFVGRGTLDRPPLIWRRTLSTCTETSALPRENFLLFFISQFWKCLLIVGLRATCCVAATVRTTSERN